MSAPLFDTPVIGCNLDAEEVLLEYVGNVVILSSLFEHELSMITVHGALMVRSWELRSDKTLGGSLLAGADLRALPPSAMLKIGE